MNYEYNQSMNRSQLVPALLVVLALVLAACAPTGAATQPAPAETDAAGLPGTAPAETEAGGLPGTGEEAAINVAADPNLGEILVDGQGMTLYVFGNDGPNTVNCTDDCLTNWPPLVSEGAPALGEGVDPALIGSAPLPDGTMVVTYNSMPLYRFADDMAPGDVNGQGVNDVWFVVSPDGTPVGME